MKRIGLLVWMGCLAATSAWAQQVQPAFGPGGPELMWVEPSEYTGSQVQRLGLRVSRHTSLYRIADDIVRATNRKVLQCGLGIVDPWSAGLPYPQTNADSAIINRWVRLLAYYDLEDGYGSFHHVYKNPDGGMRHGVEVSQRELDISTPYRGVIATIHRVTSETGYDYYYRCGNYQVTANEFAFCVERNFVDLIARQLCRYAR